MRYGQNSKQCVGRAMIPVAAITDKLHSSRGRVRKLRSCFLYSQIPDKKSRKRREKLSKRNVSVKG